MGGGEGPFEWTKGRSIGRGLRAKLSAEREGRCYLSLKNFQVNR